MRTLIRKQFDRLIEKGVSQYLTLDSWHHIVKVRVNNKEVPLTVIKVKQGHKFIDLTGYTDDGTLSVWVDFYHRVKKGGTFK